MGLSSASGQHINCILPSTLSSMLNVKCSTDQSCVLVGGSARGLPEPREVHEAAGGQSSWVGQVPFALL